MSGLTEDSWNLISASVCNLWLSVVLVEAYAENLASQRIYVIRKGRSILTVCTDNCGYSFLMLHRNSTIGSPLHFSCNAEAKTVLVNFL